MGTYAEIKNGVITNKAKFEDTTEIPYGWINVTGMVCGIGDPIVDGSPVPRPSKWHTRNGLEWVISTDSQAKKDAAEKVRAIGILSAIDSKSIRAIREFLISKFENDPAMPEFLKKHESDAVSEREKLK